jgi:hypothetical protein
MATKEAKMCVARKTRANINEGRPLKQSVAIAFSQCRREGFKLPRKMRKVS